MLDVRSEVFRLRQQDPPLSYARIAATLGITKSRVQRELSKTARETTSKRGEASGVDGGGGGNGGPVGPSWHPGVDAAIAQDPDLVERRKALERSRLELQELQLEAQRAEAQRRIAVLKASATVGGGESAGALANIAALLISELGGIRTDLSQAVATIGARVVQQQALAPPAPPPLTLSDRLQEFRETAAVLNAYAPQRPPSSRDELEFKAMMERLGMEERRISRQFEADLEERRERAAGQRARDEAVAKAIEGTAPLLQAAAERWMRAAPDGGDQASRSAPARPHVIEGGQAGRSDPALLPGETRVTCPRCETEFAMTPGGSDDKCPGCGLEIALLDGKAVPRGANGTGRRAEPPRFAS